jgi:hypothetical protein
MFECERCGSSYSASHLGVENCPRCQLLDRVQAPLAFKAFQRQSPPEAVDAPAAAAPVAADPGTSAAAEAA